MLADAGGAVVAAGVAVEWHVEGAVAYGAAS